MKSRLFILIGTLLWILGCGDDPRVDGGDIPKLQSYIHFVPSSYYGTSYLQFASVRTKEIPQGESGRLVAEIRVDGSSISSDYASDYIQNFIWMVDDKSYISSSLTQTFPDTGIFDVELKTIDFFNDTLKDTLTLYVTTPLSILPQNPTNGFNTFSAFDSAGMTFEIQTLGINSWQDVVCKLYISLEKSTVWESFYDTIPCNGSYTIPGPFLSGDSTLLADTAIAFYWAATAEVPDTELEFNTDTTSIQVFYSALIGTDSSHLVIPIRYRSLASSITPRGTLLLQNSKGDTIAQRSILSNPSAFHFTRISPDTLLTVTVFDTTLSEYGKAVQSFSLSKSSYFVLDTLDLYDSVPPVRIPAKSRYAYGDSVQFYLYDGGSGVSQNSITVMLASDTIGYRIHGDVVTFIPRCALQCELAISFRDYAGNPSSSVIWNVKRDGDSLNVLGPYNPGDL
ncbi:MAG: hypothetical protein J6Z31_05545 [Fibrobacter sp.]|nr:hypothetical protein [Fibrobacter sp.]